jgi:hypothetical protein
VDKMLKHSASTHGQSSIEEAWGEFHLWENETDFDPDSAQMSVFIPWFFYSWFPEDSEQEVTPAASFLEERGKGLDALQVEYLEACIQRGFSFFEILETWPGKGCKAVDILTGETRDVAEKSGSSGIEPNDIVFGMVVTVQQLTTFEAFAPFAIPPIYKPQIISLRQHLQKGNRTVTQLVLQDFALEIIELYQDIHNQLFNAPPPVLHNTDGDLLVPHRMTYKTASA